MRAWLDGDLSGVDPRAELDLLREAVASGADRGDDLRELWRALARIDPVACAELATGPRAVPHPIAVEACLVAVDALESVVAPSGLYPRLATLAPAAGPAVLEVVARRHPGADWVARLSRRFDPVPGRVHLILAAEVGALELACASCARAALVDGMAAAAGELGTLEPAAALIRQGRMEGAQLAAARAFDQRPDLPLLPTLAAVYGPELDPFLAGVARQLRRDEPRAILLRQATGLPLTREALAPE